MGQENEELYRSVCEYFRREMDSIRNDFEEGELVDYRDRVILSRKLDDALSRIAPYCRSDTRARELVREAEELRKRLLSVRDIIVTKPV